MDRRIRLISLYDYYSGLLTEKQCQYFEEYYFSNLTLQEVADLERISRNAVFRQLQKIEEKLNFYEEVLNLYEKDKKLLKIIEKIDDEQIRKELEEL